MMGKRITVVTHLARRVDRINTFHKVREYDKYVVITKCGRRLKRENCVNAYNKRLAPYVEFDGVECEQCYPQMERI